MHSVFLYHAIRAGLNMGIVNAGLLPLFDEIPLELKNQVEDVILNRREDAAGKLTEYAEFMKKSEPEEVILPEWRKEPPAKRLSSALVKGCEDFIEEDIKETLLSLPDALSIVEGPLMDGMKEVGNLFDSGKMFLPQVIKSARVMKKAVACLNPVFEKQRMPGDNSTGRKILLATVKGDVHDIGKNIVGLILSCNNYEVIDLGVMVSCEKIIRTAIEMKADAIGLSGLITPSLEEIIHVAKEMEQNHLQIPLLVGGATTSEIHTAVKIAPLYHGIVLHVRDASKCAGLVSPLFSPHLKESFTASLKEKYTKIRTDYQNKSSLKKYIPLGKARENKYCKQWKTTDITVPSTLGNIYFHDYSLEEISAYIDWSFFFHAYGMRGSYPAILADS